MRRDPEVTPQQTAMSLDSCDGPHPGGSQDSWAPVLDAPLPVFPVLPQPPGAAARTRPAPAQPGGTLDAQWMEQTWRSAKVGATCFIEDRQRCDLLRLRLKSLRTRG